MENQVKLSCFSPVRVHLEIWLQLFWRLLDQNQSHVRLHYKSFYWIKHSKLSTRDRRDEEIECETAKFDHVDNLQTFEIQIKYETVALKG